MQKCHTYIVVNEERRVAELEHVLACAASHKCQIQLHFSEDSQLLAFIWYNATSQHQVCSPLET